MPESGIARYVEQAKGSFMAADVVVDRFTIPLPEVAHHRLVWLAERFCESQSRLASDLLRLAIDEAISQLRPAESTMEELREDIWAQNPDLSSDTVEDVALRLFEATRRAISRFDSALEVDYRRWLGSGKRPPRAPGELSAEERKQLEVLRDRAEVEA